MLRLGWAVFATLLIVGVSACGAHKKKDVRPRADALLRALPMSDGERDFKNDNF